MKNKFLLSAILVVFSVSLFAQMQKNKGYPTANPDLRSEFVNPPKGYGNIPFYWWSGDRLNKERLKEQLKILSQSATDGFSVSYIHTDPEVDSVLIKMDMAFLVEQVREIQLFSRRIGGISGIGILGNALNWD